MNRLAALGPRLAGSDADRSARQYLVDRFLAAGAEVRVATDGTRRHLLAVIPGESDDALLLVAAYPVLARDEWIGDDGAALLLELARVLAFERPRYTLEFALAETRPDSRLASEIDGVEDPRLDAVIGERAGSEHGERGADQSGLERAVARRQIVAAGESLARALAEEGDFERLRGVLVFEGPSRPGLRIARDLGSHPIYREIVWASAAELGYGGIFPKDAGWVSVESLQIGFEERAMDRVLALVDETRARPELAAEAAAAESSPTSLESVGFVTIEALGRIMHRLSRVDAFSFARDAAAASPQTSPQTVEILPSS